MRLPDIQVVVFSDAALLTTKTEYSIEDFYKIVRSFKFYIEQRVGDTYCIVNRDKNIGSLTPKRQIQVGNDNIPKFIFIGGSGAAWINLWLADSALKNRKDWHEYYSLYCVDEQSKPSLLSEKDSYPFNGYDSKERLLIALE